MPKTVSKPIPASLQYVLLLVAALVILGGLARIWPLADETGLSQAHAYNAKSGIPAHGQLVAKTRCFSCHGTDGNSSNPLYPNLAGQSASFIYTQLLAFKTGDRTSPIMSGIAAAMSVQDAEDVASYYAAQTLKPDPAANGRLAVHGEQVFYSRSGMRMMSSCAACHQGDGRQQAYLMGMMSRRMMGVMTQSDSTDDIPKLNGQHAAYLLEQLNDFASGKRPSAVMTPIAGRLNEADRKAVAAYLSGLH